MCAYNVSDVWTYFMVHATSKSIVLAFRERVPIVSMTKTRLCNYILIFNKNEKILEKCRFRKKNIPLFSTEWCPNFQNSSWCKYILIFLWTKTRNWSISHLYLQGVKSVMMFFILCALLHIFNSGGWDGKKNGRHRCESIFLLLFFRVSEFYATQFPVRSSKRCFSCSNYIRQSAMKATKKRRNQDC